MTLFIYPLIHKPIGIQVAALQTGKLTDQQQSQWLEHHSLERGNAVKVIKLPP